MIVKSLALIDPLTLRPYQDLTPGEWGQHLDVPYLCTDCGTRHPTLRSVLLEGKYIFCRSCVHKRKNT